jgi:hypothetical protein
LGHYYYDDVPISCVVLTISVKQESRQNTCTTSSGKPEGRPVVRLFGENEGIYIVLVDVLTMSVGSVQIKVSQADGITWTISARR